MSGTLVVYPNGTDQPGVEFKCANGFVSRVVSAVAAQNIPDAERVCQILNATDAELTSAKARLTARSMDMLQLRGMLINVRDNLEDEDDRVFFGSTNDADDFRQAVEILDGWHWSVVMQEAKGEDLLGELRAARARITELEALLAETREVVKPLAEAGRIKLCGDWRDDQSVQGTDTAFFVKFGDLRRAAALSTKLEAQG